MDLGELQGKSISVIGAARSGIAVAKLLQSRGARVFVSDRESRERLQTQLDVLESTGIAFEAGEHSDRAYRCSLMVISPGVPGNAPVVQKARESGIRIVGELEVASWFCKASIVAVTGTNGKTTTTTLIGRMLADAKRDHGVAGNIGTAFSSLALELAETSVAVLEVSSFQLDHIETFHPRVAAILNITPDHLDRYGGSFEEYVESKSRIFKNQGANDTLIYNCDDTVTAGRAMNLRDSAVQLLPFSTEQSLSSGACVKKNKVVIANDNRMDELMDVREIRIRGRHNLYNAMAAALAARTVDVSADSIRQTLMSFEGVEHRL
ncbi:MAG TPA: UDP-N-acetylmuramoyl-L-alanine--D-glutamate ligase, partial [Bacteroidota bacterium]